MFPVCRVGAPCRVSNHSRSALLQNRMAANNAPSGIAQLRKTSDQNLVHSEPMNLDDFIFSENVATPAGLAASPSPEFTTRQLDDRAAHAPAPAAIPIKSRKTSLPTFVPQSVPVPPHQRTKDEFSYVTRHTRKTSVDERRVSAPGIPNLYVRRGWRAVRGRAIESSLLFPCI